MTEFVEVSSYDGWVEIAMNRPERKNAMIGPLAQALRDAIDDADANPDVNLILLKGNGGAFCSGLDLKAFNESPEPAWLSSFSQTWRSLHERIYSADTPIVGALERYAINGGAALALACDLLIAGDGAFLQVGEVQQGMAAPMNMAWLRLRHPEVVAARVALVGDRLLGQDLANLGIAYQSVPDDQVIATAHKFCTRLGSYPDGSLGRIKAGIRAYRPAGSATPAAAAAWFDQAVSTAGGGRVKPSKQDG